MRRTAAQHRRLRAPRVWTNAMLAVLISHLDEAALRRGYTGQLAKGNPVAAEHYALELRLRGLEP